MADPDYYYVFIMNEMNGTLFFHSLFSEKNAFHRFGKLRKTTVDLYLSSGIIEVLSSDALALF